MEIDFNAIDPSRRYGLMIRAITPRPIAWVSTLSAEGISNLAPFSYFAGVGSDPPVLMVSVANKPDGSPKDTLRNAEATGELVVNIVPYSLRMPMGKTAADLPFNESEFAFAELTEAPSKTVRPPRLLESPISFECRVHDIVKIGSANAIFGIIQWMYADDSVLDADGKIDPHVLDTIGRLGGRGYSRTTERFDM